MEIEKKDYVETLFNGVKFDGIVKSINTKYNDAVVVMSPGVEMTFALEELTLLRKHREEETND